MILFLLKSDVYDKKQVCYQITQPPKLKLFITNHTSKQKIEKKTTENFKKFYCSQSRKLLPSMSSLVSSSYISCPSPSPIETEGKEN